MKTNHSNEKLFFIFFFDSDINLDVTFATLIEDTVRNEILLLNLNEWKLSIFFSFVQFTKLMVS